MKTPSKKSAQRTVPCPYCQKPSLFSSDNVYRPFCSERCQLLDLGAWADEKFKIPTPQNPHDTVNENSEGEDEIH